MIFLVIQVLIWIVLIDAILSWIPSIDRRNPIVAAIRRITEPIYRPIRTVIPPEKTGYVDFAPLATIIGLQILSAIIARVF